MELTGPEIAQVTDAILAAYSREELRILLLTCMDEDLDSLVQPNALKIEVFHLVEWANRTGRVVELIRHACDNRKQNERLQTTLSQLLNKNKSPHRTILDALEQLTIEALLQHESVAVIPYQEREADVHLRSLLTNMAATKYAHGGWLVLGNAGIGKTTLLLHAAKWCKESEPFLPIWLDASLFHEGGSRLSRLLDCSPSYWGEALQQLAVSAAKRLVIFIDSLDSIVLQISDVARFVTQLNELAFNALLVCSCRPPELKYIQQFGAPKLETVNLTQLSYQQVIQVLQDLQHEYHITLKDIHPSLIEMCQDPFNLHLLLESSRTEPLPQISKPTETWLRRKFWDRRVERLRADALLDSRLASISKERLTSARVELVYAIAEALLHNQTYKLSQQQVSEMLRTLALTDLEQADLPLKWALLFELESDGIVLYHNEYLSFWHDSFADFVVCKHLLMRPDWHSKVTEFLNNIAVAFYYPIAVRLVLQARDEGRIDAEDLAYRTMLTFLESKGNQHEITRSWGVTYALRQLAPIWVERLCKSLEMHCRQAAASSIADVLGDVGRPELVLPTLIEGMNYYHLKKRFVDSLGAYRDPRTVEPLLALLEKLVFTREDDELIENVVAALQKIGDARAESLLTVLEKDESFPIAARRIARHTLWEMTNQLCYSEPIPHTEQELIEGLQLYDRRNPAQYSDWKVVKRTAEICLAERKLGRTLSVRVEEALVNALRHQHEDAQHSVVRALVRVNNVEAAVSALKEKASSGQTPDGTRRLLVDSLGKIWLGPAATPELRQQICEIVANVANNDSNLQVRREAAMLCRSMHCSQIIARTD